MDGAKGTCTSGNWLVFVSHSGTDTWVAQQIARKITECGATPFLDEANIDVGSDFEEEIHAFLKKANELLVLLTPWALERPYVVMEIGAAWIREIPIVALLQGLTTTQVQGHAKMLGLLKRRNLVPLNEIERYLEELRARVQSHHEAAI